MSGTTKVSWLVKGVKLLNVLRSTVLLVREPIPGTPHTPVNITPRLSSGTAAERLDSCFH